MEKKEIRWSQEALEDLQKILIYIGRQSPPVAEKVGDAIYERTSELELFPRIGTGFKFHGRRYRRITVKGYYVIYEILGNEVNVRSVFRATRDIRGAMMRLDDDSTE